MAHSEEEAVRRVVQQYIDGTYQGDVKVLRNCFHLIKENDEWKIISKIFTTE